MSWFNRKAAAPVVPKSDYPIVSYDYSSSVSLPQQSTSVGQKSYPVYTVDMLSQLSGGHVSEYDALGVEAFYSCILDQSGTIGSLPLKMYRQGVLDDRPIRVRSGQIHKVITERPNDYQSSQEFVEMLVASYHTNGAFYAVPFRDAKGRLVELVPFANQRAVRANMDLNGQVYYTYTMNDGKSTISARPEELFIVKGLTLDGYTPIRPLSAQAQLMGMAMNQEEGYANLQQNGITSQMALGTDNLFDDQNARQRLKEDFQKFRGPAGRKEIPILEQGLKPIPLNLTPQELDLLNQREFTVKRICAMTQTMPHRIGAETLKTSDKIFELDEAQFKKWNPLLVKIEHEMTRVAGRYISVSFNRKAFYAGSPARLVEAVEREVKGGLASIAEGREDLGRDFEPDTEGVFCIESNNCTYGSWADLQKIRMTEDTTDVSENNPND
ncbi:portal protein [Vibrio phage 2.044.O._10N.261.51.B8]|nr:portal protein [Vibrio phage 2.044.O._10N.261.51.B8]